MQQNATADYLFICSGLAAVDASRVLTFLTSAIPGGTYPEIIDGYTEAANAPGRKVLFYVDDEDLNADALDCLGQFPGFDLDLVAEVRSQAEVIGTVPDFLASQPLGQYMDPVHSTWSYRRGENWLLASYISSAPEASRLNSALTELFGMPLENCILNPACEAQSDAASGSDRYPLDR